MRRIEWKEGRGSVALVQTASTLPVFLFALPAGALADISGKRRLLIVLEVT
jgi:MFS family permease